VQVGGGDLILSVSDEGPGFDSSQIIDGSKHLGIAGMRERLRAEGGSFELESAPGRGTRIVACLPLKTEVEVRGGQDPRPDSG
jgi:signal transduction histidine kinase